MFPYTRSPIKAMALRMNNSRADGQSKYGVDAFQYTPTKQNMESKEQAFSTGDNFDIGYDT